MKRDDDDDLGDWGAWVILFAVCLAVGWGVDGCSKMLRARYEVAP